MENLTIRPFSTIDSDAMKSLSNDIWNIAIQGFTQKLLDNLNDKAIKCVVAYDKDVLCGFVLGYDVIPFDTLIPEFMYVAPNYRGKGISSLLMAELEALSKCHISKIYYNKSLCAMYKKQGYIIGDNVEVAMKPLQK